MQDMAFDLQDFYYNILFLFEDEQDDNWASETLAYWNKYVARISQFIFVTKYGLFRHFFPLNGRSRTSRKRQAIPPPTDVNDLVKLRNERARRRELALANSEDSTELNLAEVAT